MSVVSNSWCDESAVSTGNTEASNSLVIIQRDHQKFPHTSYLHSWGTGIRVLMRGMATLPQGNLELLVVRDKVGRPTGELGVSKSVECDIFPSVLWHCWLGDRKGIRSVKNKKTGCWFVGGDDLTGALQDLWLQLSSCHHHLHHPLLQKTLANPGSPGKWPLMAKRELFTFP